ncbi:MAG: hypothetical protein IIB43_07565 [Candidatus Marinimicrobia bacterium]|nr:hypothetical protein [Candidatus Neomarinimicrobiota bacterium]
MIYKFCISFIIFLLSVGSVAALAGQDWAKALEAQLESKYTITQRSIFGRYKNIGTVLIILKDGIQVEPPKVVMRPTVIKAGKLERTGTGGIILGTNARVLRPGDRVYLYDVNVSKKGVTLIIATTETFDIVVKGTTESTPFKTALLFKFEPGFLARASLTDVLKDINIFIVSESEADAASTKTVQMGQSPEEVKEIFGRPGKIIELGSKLIYVYDDIKITFRDGKVADVE